MKQTFRENTYADENGNVYSDKTGRMKPLKPQKVNNTRSKKQYWFIAGKGLVHRLVASAYLGNVDGLTVNHKDGNPSNNVVSNLEIVTQKENHHHALANGFAPKGENHGRSIYSNDTLLKALRMVAEGRSVNSVAVELNISQSYLNKVKNGTYRSDLSEQI